MINHYAVLGVLPSASMEEVKSSYRQLVKRFHPDTGYGTTQQFARIREAYVVLSDLTKRKEFDAAWSRQTQALREATKRKQGAQPKPRRKEQASQAPVAMLTRLMSIAVPRSGRFQLQGIIGNISINPTLPENLWDTTLRKFGGGDKQRLSRHIIQIKLSGERDLVRSMMPRPTDFGVEFQKQEEAEQKNKIRKFLGNIFQSGPLGSMFNQKPFGMYGAHLPLNLELTVPKGVTLHLDDITGSIVVGDMESNLVAKLLGGSLQAGQIKKVKLTMKGASRAFLPHVDGMVDLMGFGESKAVLDGEITQMRVVLENSAKAEVRAPVNELVAEVNGQGLLEIKNTVNKAQCDVRGNAYLRIDKVTSSLKGTRSKTARVDAKVIKGRVPAVG